MAGHKCHDQGDGGFTDLEAFLCPYCLDCKLIPTSSPSGRACPRFAVRKLRLGGTEGTTEPSLDWTPNLCTQGAASIGGRHAGAAPAPGLAWEELGGVGSSKGEGGIEQRGTWVTQGALAGTGGFRTHGGANQCVSETQRGLSSSSLPRPPGKHLFPVSRHILAKGAAV